MDMLRNGLEWLSQKQSQFVSSTVIYRRGGEEYSVPAVFGRTVFDVTDDYGMNVEAHSIDFLIDTEHLPVAPESGDTILANNRTFEVLELAGTCWKWCDPHGIKRRIHTREIT